LHKNQTFYEKEPRTFKKDQQDIKKGFPSTFTGDVCQPQKVTRGIFADTEAYHPGQFIRQWAFPDFRNKLLPWGLKKSDPDGANH
jgi:hypothetical protein